MNTRKWLWQGGDRVCAGLMVALLLGSYGQAVAGSGDFSGYDSDQDGYLNRVEFEAFALERRSSKAETDFWVLERVDKDGDHRVSKTELISALKAYLSRDKEVKYSAAELAPEMVPVKGGCFQMGSPPDEPGRGNDESQHRICVGDFAIGRFEVTFDEFDRFVRATGKIGPSDLGWGRGKRPVINVSWHDAIAYTEWLSAETGSHYRLPTEAEWEYAARAGTVAAYSWGGGISRLHANYGADRCCAGSAQGMDHWEFTAPVGSFPPSPAGLFDTAGNVEEWTCSAYDRRYSGDEGQCAESVTDGLRAVRGGSWGDVPQWLRSAKREGYMASAIAYNVGFRLLQER